MSRGVFHEPIGGSLYLVRTIEERRDVQLVQGVHQPHVRAWLPREVPPPTEPETIPLGVGLAAVFAAAVALVIVSSVLLVFWR